MSAISMPSASPPIVLHNLLLYTSHVFPFMLIQILCVLTKLMTLWFESFEKHMILTYNRRYNLGTTLGMYNNRCNTMT